MKSDKDVTKIKTVNLFETQCLQMIDLVGQASALLAAINNYIWQPSVHAVTGRA